MRHLKSGRKFGRNSSHRKALFRNMATSLLIHDRISTTDEKAKELRRYVERMITLARKAHKVGVVEEGKVPAQALHYRRQALGYVRLPGIDATSADDRKERKALLDKLFVSLAERYAERPGGYTRILKVGNRRGDGAAISLIEFVEGAAGEEAKSARKKPRRRKKPGEKAKAAPAAAAPEKIEPENTEPEATEPVPEPEQAEGVPEGENEPAK